MGGDITPDRGTSNVKNMHFLLEIHTLWHSSCP